MLKNSISRNILFYVKKILMLLLFLSLSNLYSLDTQIVTDKYSVQRLWEKSEWLQDAERKFTIESIVNQEFSKEAKFDHGLTTNRIWERYRIQVQEEGSWIIFSRWQKVDRINFYAIYPDGKVVSSASGSSVKAQEQPFRYRRPTFELNLSVNEPIDLYVSIDSLCKIHSDLKITGSLNYFQDSIRDERILLWAFGAIISITLYNLIVFFATKDKNYLFYFLYIFFMLLYDVTVEGYGRYYLWPDWEWLFSRDYNIFVSLCFVFVVLFSRSFLNLKDYSKKLYTVSNAAVIVFSMNTVLFMLPPSSIVVNFSTFCFFFGIGFLLVSGIFTLSRGYKPARFYLLAWTCLITGSAITTMRRIHILPDTLFTEYAIYIGTVLESILLAFALGDRVLTIQNKKLEAEEALIDANNRILQNRMKPHFLFNSMNIIFNQIVESPQDAMNSLKLLSDNYHFITEFTDKKIILLREEINFLKNYLHLMQLRWPKTLRVVYTIQEEILDLPVPPFILQPLAENAFKHSLNKTSNKELEISIQLLDNQILLRVINTTADKLGYIDYSRSLGNILQRIRNYYRNAELIVYQRENMVISEITFTNPGIKKG